MGMREYNAGNKTTRLVGKWGIRKGGYSKKTENYIYAGFNFNTRKEYRKKK